MSEEEKKKKIRYTTHEEASALLAEQRVKCREIETQTFDSENSFKYKARELWWEYCEKTQMCYPTIMSFREFWDNENSYPRTIAINDGPVTLSKR